MADDKSYLNRINLIIENYCDANDISKSEYAKRAGVSKAWISRIQNESNKHISLDVAIKLLNVADYTIKISNNNRKVIKKIGIKNKRK